MLLPLGLNVGTAAILVTTSIPLSTLPNTTFSPSSEGAGAGPVVMRNSVPADLARLYPPLPSPSPVAAPTARDTVPGRRCLSLNDADESISGFESNPGVWTCPSL